MGVSGDTGADKKYVGVYEVNLIEEIFGERAEVYLALFYSIRKF